MADHSLGKVTTSSITTGARFTANLGTPTDTYLSQGYVVQALGTNTGVVYVCDTATPNLTTQVGVLYEIPAPDSSAATGSRPLLGVDNPENPNGFDLSKHYVLPTVTGEGLRVTAIRT